MTMGMDFLTALHVSGSAMSAERTRVNLASSNLANAETTRGPDGKPYRRLDPVFRAVTMGDGSPAGAAATAPMGVEVEKVVADNGPGRKVYSPGHPDADADGFVTFPNVNPVHEVVNLLSASRAYEASATAVETLKQMATRGLDITR
jgi:flagellar basal-body rod protein FlgC